MDKPSYAAAMEEAATITERLLAPHCFVLIAFERKEFGRMSLVSNQPSVVGIDIMRQLVADYDAGQIPAKTYQEHPIQ